MSDTLHIDAEPTCGYYSASYDPEGPSGHGKTQQHALRALIESCIDDNHRMALLADAIVALARELAEAEAKLLALDRVERQRDQFAREADELKRELADAKQRRREADERCDKHIADWMAAVDERNQARSYAEELRGALLELRIRLHSSGRRPEECYEMSVIDAALNSSTTVLNSSTKAMDRADCCKHGQRLNLRCVKCEDDRESEGHSQGIGYIQCACCGNDKTFLREPVATKQHNQFEIGGLPCIHRTGCVNAENCKEAGHCTSYQKPHAIGNAP